MTRDDLKALIRDRDDLFFEVETLKKMGENKESIDALSDIEKVDLDIRYRKLVKKAADAEKKYAEALEKYLNLDDEKNSIPY